MTTQLKAGYLNKIVYLRKGTNLLVPETKANQKDQNLVPMTVADAIKHGYMSDPKKTLQMDPIEEQLREENARLLETVQQMQKSQEAMALQMHELTSKLTNAEAVAEFPVSVGTETPVEEQAPAVLQGEGSVIPPVEGAPVVNMALDADDDGLSDIVADAAAEPEASEDNTQAELDALLGKTEEQ